MRENRRARITLAGELSVWIIDDANELEILESPMGADPADSLRRMRHDSLDFLGMNKRGDVGSR